MFLQTSYLCLINRIYLYALYFSTPNQEVKRSFCVYFDCFLLYAQYLHRFGNGKEKSVVIYAKSTQQKSVFFMAKSFLLRVSDIPLPAGGGLLSFGPLSLVCTAVRTASLCTRQYLCFLCPYDPFLCGFVCHKAACFHITAFPLDPNGFTGAAVRRFRALFRPSESLRFCSPFGFQYSGSEKRDLPSFFR